MIGHPLGPLNSGCFEVPTPRSGHLKMIYPKNTMIKVKSIIHTSIACDVLVMSEKMLVDCHVTLTSSKFDFLKIFEFPILFCFVA